VAEGLTTATLGIERSGSLVRTVGTVGRSVPPNGVKEVQLLAYVMVGMDGVLAMRWIS
jgi:hypothetical protein